MTYPDNLRLRPSSAKSWMVCTAGPRFCAEHAAELPDSGSAYADEGSLAHTVAEKMLRNEPYTCDPTMAAYAQGYADRGKASIGVGDTTTLEASVPLWYMPEREGRIDFIRVGPVDRHLLIRDLKYGQGVVVEAEDNEQLAIYAWSFIRKHHGEFGFGPGWTVTMEIDQPRAREGEPVKSWSVTFEELDRFCSRIGAVARKILANEAVEFVSGDACRFCPARKGYFDASGNHRYCPGKASEVVACYEALPVAEASPLALPDPANLTPEQLQRIVEAKPAIEKFLEDAETSVFERLQAGHEFPGFKLVQSNTHRKWTDPVEAAKKLRLYIPKDALYSEPKLVSPSQAEKLLKKPIKPLSSRFKNALAALIEKPEGEPTLAPVSDPRPALNKPNPLDGLAIVDESIL